MPDNLEMCIRDSIRTELNFRKQRNMVQENVPGIRIHFLRKQFININLKPKKKGVQVNLFRRIIDRIKEAVEYLMSSRFTYSYLP